MNFFVYSFFNVLLFLKLFLSVSTSAFRSSCSYFVRSSFLCFIVNLCFVVLLNVIIVNGVVVFFVVIC